MDAQAQKPMAPPDRNVKNANHHEGSNIVHPIITGYGEVNRKGGAREKQDGRSTSGYEQFEKDGGHQCVHPRFDSRSYKTTFTVAARFMQNLVGTITRCLHLSRCFFPNVPSSGPNM